MMLVLIAASSRFRYLHALLIGRPEKSNRCGEDERTERHHRADDDYEYGRRVCAGQ